MVVLEARLAIGRFIRGRVRIRRRLETAAGLKCRPASINHFASTNRMSTEVATADGHAVRITVRMHLISGDEMVIDIDLAQRIVDLKRRISTFDTQKYGTIPVSRQRIVLLPEFGGHEPYEVFTDARTLASCGLENDTRLELVVFDELTPLTNVRDKLMFNCSCM